MLTPRAILGLWLQVMQPGVRATLCGSASRAAAERLPACASWVERACVLAPLLLHPDGASEFLALLHAVTGHAPPRREPLEAGGKASAPPSARDCSVPPAPTAQHASVRAWPRP